MRSGSVSKARIADVERRRVVGDARVGAVAGRRALGRLALHELRDLRRLLPRPLVQMSIDDDGLGRDDRRQPPCRRADWRPPPALAVTGITRAIQARIANRDGEGSVSMPHVDGKLVRLVGRTSSSVWISAIAPATGPRAPSARPWRRAGARAARGGPGRTPRVTSSRVSRSRRATSNCTLSPALYCSSRAASPSARTRTSSMARISSSTFRPAVHGRPSRGARPVTIRRPLSLRVIAPRNARACRADPPGGTAGRSSRALRV